MKSTLSQEGDILMGAYTRKSHMVPYGKFTPLQSEGCAYRRPRVLGSLPNVHQQSVADLQG
jgi:hypothetical protein